MLAAVGGLATTPHFRTLPYLPSSGHLRAVAAHPWCLALQGPQQLEPCGRADAQLQHDAATCGATKLQQHLSKRLQRSVRCKWVAFSSSTRLSRCCKYTICGLSCQRIYPRSYLFIAVYMTPLHLQRRVKSHEAHSAGRWPHACLSKLARKQGITTLFAYPHMC